MKKMLTTNIEELLEKGDIIFDESIPNDEQLKQLENKYDQHTKCLNKDIDESLKNINPKKKQVCDVIIGDKFYNVFEYDLRDLSIIDNMIRTYTANDSSVIITMIKLAIPDCPLDEIHNLTQTESNELLAMIQTSSAIKRIMNSSSTIH